MHIPLWSSRRMWVSDTCTPRHPTYTLRSHGSPRPSAPLLPFQPFLPRLDPEVDMHLGMLYPSRSEQSGPAASLT